MRGELLLFTWRPWRGYRPYMYPAPPPLFKPKTRLVSQPQAGVPFGFQDVLVPELPALVNADSWTPDFVHRHLYLAECGEIELSSAEEVGSRYGYTDGSPPFGTSPLLY